jgi:hypothetical protein
MTFNWQRGLLRAWVVFAVAWIGVAGWYEYQSMPWNQNWGAYSEIRTEGECWDRLAKWPDDQPFTEWDAFADEVDVPQNVELNKKNHAWSADSIPDRNGWRHATKQKLMDCEAASPLTHRLLRRMANVWSSLEDSLAVIFLPPMALLIAGYAFGWVARGFRARHSS